MPKVTEDKVSALVDKFTDILLYHIGDRCDPPIRVHCLADCIPYGHGPKPSPAAMRDITKRQVREIIEGIL